MIKKLFIVLMLSLSISSFAQMVKPGIEVLRDQNFSILEGKKVGLVTNPTGVDSKLKSTIDILHEAPNVNLVALYGPEHGVRGDIAAGDHVEDFKDPKTGIPVYSLYGATRKPTEEMLKNVDVIVYDIQDNGARSYTYISTMGLVMEAAAEYGNEVVVLDRPNPLGGIRIEGNVAEEGYISFVSQFKIPYIYGLTCGELAKMLNDEKMLENGVQVKLTVVPMEGWTRDMIFPETGLPWVPASPHVPHDNSCFYYSATGVVGELSAVSIGVGYTIPFETFAAKWLDASTFAEEMNKLNLEGVVFRPLSYKPFYAFGKGEFLKGVQIYFTDYKKVKLLPIQFHFLSVMKKLHPEIDVFRIGEENNRIRMFDLVNGTKKVREMFSKNYNVEEVEKFWQKDVDDFRVSSTKYYLY
ncbi:MAG: hypothetical protein SCALA702_29000 [Melioribacteraceae bacterium]|nr:MAG: hypothetical protein SCALA702_29000 [Melioribacteraceae bacterium]